MVEQTARDELLSVSDVTYSYNQNGWRLEPSSFSIRPGEVVGLIGPNGSGKSTILKIAAGVLRPFSGSVLVKGRNISSYRRKELAGEVGYLPQKVENRLEYTVEEIVALGRFPYLRGIGFLDSHDLEIIDGCLIKTGMERYRKRRITMLSGGETQRTFLASVLAQEPAILLLDEPTSALDLNQQVRFFNLLAALTSEGIGAAVVTHDLNLASLYSDRIMMLRQGKIICSGSPEEVLTGNILKETYGSEISVSRHPSNGRPLVFPERKDTGLEA